MENCEQHAAHTNTAIGPELRHWLGDEPRAERTLVFTDLVDSTIHLLRLGDAAWTTLLNALDGVRRDLIDELGGHLASVAGDGALAAFDSTDQAVEFCEAFRAACLLLGLEVRSGIHRSSVETRETGDLAGIGVHLTARIQAAAAPGQILASDSAANTSTRPFINCGSRELKGFPTPVDVYQPFDGNAIATAMMIGASVDGAKTAA